VKLDFKTRIVPGTSKAEVEIICSHTAITYLIDMKKDIIDKIKYVKTNEPGTEGELIFNYFEDVENLSEKFAAPDRQIESRPLFLNILLKD
jgi:hypothetical protein